MKVIRNISIVGSSHIADKSVKEVVNAIETLKPEIVAVELDAGRAYSLKHKTKKPKGFGLIRQLGFAGYMFYVLGGFLQKKLGQIVKMEPGSEMLAAMDSAKKVNADIALIDRDIQVTLSRFSKYFRKREMLKMIFSVLSPKKEKIDFDLKSVPDEKMIDKIMEIAKKEYPSLYKVLVDERDIYMAKNLYFLSKSNPDKKIFAVVGAGHLTGMMRYLQRFFDNEPRIEITGM